MNEIQRVSFNRWYGMQDDDDGNYVSLVNHNFKVAELKAEMDAAQLQCNKFEVKAEDVDCANIHLDQLDVPKVDESGLNTYSLVGRIDAALEKQREACWDAAIFNLPADMPENQFNRIRKAIRSARITDD